MPMLPYATTGFPSSSNSTGFLIDAATDMVAFRYKCLDGSAIVKLEWFCMAKTGTPGDLNIVLCADNEGSPNVSGGVPVDIGGGSPTLVTLDDLAVTNNALHTTTFTNSYTPSAGEYVWIVLYAGAGTFDGSNRYQIRQGPSGFSATSRGEEEIADSTDTGGTWTRRTTMPACFSLLTTGDVYLETSMSVCFSAVTMMTWNDGNNPDERGVAFDLDANTRAIVWGVDTYYRISATSADFELSLLKDTTSQIAMAVDVSKFNPQINADLATRFMFTSGPYTVDGPCTVRITLRPTQSVGSNLHFTLDMSDDRRQSCRAFRDIYYTNRDGGSGSFTDNKTKAIAMRPVVDFVGLAGGGGGATRIINGGPVDA